MIFDRIGLTATHLVDDRGICLHVPHRIPAHGMTLIAADRSAAVVIAPACALEDPRLAPWLSLSGIYRVEDPSGSIARVGEGKAIDRLRRHRAAPSVLPARVVAAFSAQGEWSAPERRYLETRFAHAWVAQGNALVSTTFDKNTELRVADDKARELDGVLVQILELIWLGERVLDGDADFRPLPSYATEWPMPPTTVTGPVDDIVGPALMINLAREPTQFRRFVAGTRLRYADGRISALATVREDAVVLHTSSSVYVSPSASVGARYCRTHAHFLQAARVAGNGETGFTRVAIGTWTAASLLKLVTAGRAHQASRWNVS